MKTLKLLITGLALTTTIVAAGLVHAQADVTVTFDVDSITEISTCSSIDLGTMNVDSYADNTASPCNIVAYSNDPDGFDITIHGSLNGFEHDSIVGYQWPKLDVANDTINTSCTSNCTSEWGWRIKNGTASQYDLVKEDTDNPSGCTQGVSCNTFDASGKWHTLNYAPTSPDTPEGAETIITNNGPSDNAANFDLELLAGSGFISAGDYSETITITITPK